YLAVSVETLYWPLLRIITQHTFLLDSRRKIIDSRPFFLLLKPKIVYLLGNFGNQFVFDFRHSDILSV
ncbi:MAG: hypothetical protein AAB973_02090, partial [Patescibacteria group bacterium]